MAIPELLAGGFSFLKVPRWHDGRLSAPDMFARQVIAVDVDGSVEARIQVPDVPAGLGWAAQR